MHFGVRETAVAISVAATIFCCSCEKHHVGEDPEYQKEHVDVAGGGSEETSAATKEQPAASPISSTSPTPVEFFPATTPSP